MKAAAAALVAQRAGTCAPMAVGPVGLPGKVPGDLYAVLNIALPPAASAPEQAAWRGLAHAFADYNPRAALEASSHG